MDYTSPQERGAVVRDYSLLSHRTRQYDMAEGEIIRGRVLRLPARSEFRGKSIILEANWQEVIALYASERAGHTVLERELVKQDVRVDDEIEITYHGLKPSRDGERTYRLYSLEVAKRAKGSDV